MGYEGIPVYRSSVCWEGLLLAEIRCPNRREALVIVRARSLCHKHFHCLINARQTFVNFVETNSLTFRTVLRSCCGVLRLFIYLSVLKHNYGNFTKNFWAAWSSLYAARRSPKQRQKEKDQTFQTQTGENRGETCGRGT